MTYFEPRSLNTHAYTQTEQGRFFPLSLMKPSLIEVKRSHSKKELHQDLRSSSECKPRGPCLFYFPKEDRSKEPLPALICKLHRTLGERQKFDLGIHYSSIFTNAAG